MDYSSLQLTWDFPGKNTGVGCHFLLQRVEENQNDLKFLKVFINSPCYYSTGGMKINWL